MKLLKLTIIFLTIILNHSVTVAQNMAFHSILIILFISIVAGCGSDNHKSNKPKVSLIERAKIFRSEVKQENYEAADSPMVVNPRRWWGKRSGEGNLWTIGKGKHGPWANWDDHFETRQEIIKWKEKNGSVILTARETNDYFQLLDRGWVTNEITYYFNEEGKIEGLLIKANGERPPGKTDEFLAWAKKNHPQELEELMPEGEIDPSDDRPERFRRLLNEWRISADLQPIGK